MAAAGSEVIDERGGMDRLLGALAFMDDNVIDTGILVKPHDPSALNADVIMIDDDKKQNSDNLTVGNVAGFHEFGFGVPERSFVRIGIDAHTLMIERFIGDEIRAAINGRKAAVAMANIGEFVADRMKYAITASLHGRPLSKKRLEKKQQIGTPRTPLINWGIMIDTLNYNVYPVVIS